MVFTEPLFLFVFLPILLGLWWAGRGHAGYANWLLVLASILFYARGGGAFTILMLASIAFNYSMAILVDRHRGTPRAWQVLTTAVAVNLVVLGIFKYANFFADNVSAFLTSTGGASLDWPRIALPIGISFYTFHAISYVVDVYRGDAVAQKRPVHAALYLLLFPQLIAGPIIRYRDLAWQLASRLVSPEAFAWGVRRFTIGLAKKVLVANTVAEAADRIFAMPAAELTPGHAWLAVAAYTIQIYFDFSGYSDMAVGLGRMFGFVFPENFRWPYAATSIQDFWRRWHITLSAWFRDYLYIPLGGSRASRGRTLLNLVTVFFLCGLWHGASWTFVVWGLYHGTFLVAERVIEHGGPTPAWWRVVRHAYVLLVVMVGWVFFRADSMEHAFAMLAAMAGRASSAPTPFTVAWYLPPPMVLAMCAGIVGSLPIGDWLRRRVGEAPGDGVVFSAPMGAASVVLVCVLLVLSFAQVAARTYDPFIYFRF